MAMVESAPRSITVTLETDAATRALAAQLAVLARPGDVIALVGDLGAGKTTVARAFINALPRPGVRIPGPPEEVPSPTFTLVQTYDRDPTPVWHFDLYRLERPEEVYELGFEDALVDGIVLIEWPERLGRLLPAGRLELRLDFGTDAGQRHCRLTDYDGWQERLSRLASGLPAQHKA